MQPVQNLLYPESHFGGFTDIDGTIAFYSRVNALAMPDARVLDFGCGRGSAYADHVFFRRELRNLRGKVRKVIGLDTDKAGAQNPLIDEFRLVEPDKPWPVEDASSDLIVCDCVVEHLPDPGAAIAEAARTLAPGGHLCIRTPNLISYVGLMSRLISNRHHAKVLARAQAGREAQDVFPTLYRCNTVFALRRALERSGFHAVVYGYDSEPRYLEFSRLAYRLGVLYQKFAPGFMRSAIFAFARRLR